MRILCGTILAACTVGQVMKLSKGKADPKIVGGIVARKLAGA